MHQHSSGNLVVHRHRACSSLPTCNTAAHRIPNAARRLRQISGWQEGLKDCQHHVAAACACPAPLPVQQQSRRWRQKSSVSAQGANVNGLATAVSARPQACYLHCFQHLWLVNYMKHDHACVQSIQQLQPVTRMELCMGCLSDCAWVVCFSYKPLASCSLMRVPYVCQEQQQLLIACSQVVKLKGCKSPTHLPAFAHSGFQQLLLLLPQGIISTVLSLGTLNRVLYRLALVPLKDYVFFLAQAQNVGYLLIYYTLLFLRYRCGESCQDVFCSIWLRTAALSVALPNCFLWPAAGTAATDAAAAGSCVCWQAAAATVQLTRQTPVRPQCSREKGSMHAGSVASGVVMQKRRVMQAPMCKHIHTTG